LNLFNKKKKAKAIRAKKNLPAVIWSGWRGASSEPRPRTFASSVVIAMRLLAATIIRAALTGLGARILILGFDV
tara:strand:- start:621 stop:842 length:222 start_codon:yes stop_codon:yes gene_type:complete